MNKWVIIALVGGGVVIVAVAVVLFPRAAQSWARNAALSKCAELQRRRAQLAAQGTEVNELAALDSEIRACSSSAQALGAELDMGEVSLDGCLDKSAKIQAEWTHYRSTDYSDSWKRNNTRGTMLRLGEDMARCFMTAIDDAESAASLEKIKNAIAREIARAEDRERCYLNDVSGCGRFALSEPHGNDKAADERSRVIEPLRAAYDAAVEKLRTLQPASASRFVVPRLDRMLR